MQIALTVFLLFFSLIFQFTVIPLFSIKGITPNLVIIVVISIAFRYGQLWGVIAGFFSGLIFDMFGTGFVGISSLAYSICAYGVGFLASEQLQRRFSIIIGLLFVALVVQDILYFFVISVGTSISFWETLIEQAIPHSLYTLVFIVIIHLLMPKMLWGAAGRYKGM